VCCYVTASSEILFLNLWCLGFSKLDNEMKIYIDLWISVSRLSLVTWRKRGIPDSDLIAMKCHLSRGIWSGRQSRNMLELFVDVQVIEWWVAVAGTSQNPWETIILMENHYLQYVLSPRYFRHISMWIWCVSKCQLCFTQLWGKTQVLMWRWQLFNKNKWHFFLLTRHTTIYKDPRRTIRAKMLHRQSIMMVLSD
jgi:hypothetical protein